MIPAWQSGGVTLYNADVLDGLRALPSGSVQCCVTSPPYWGLRDYQTGIWEGGDPDHAHDRVLARGGRGGSGSPGKQTDGSFPADLAANVCSCGAHRIDKQIGLESSPREYVKKMVEVFREIHRVLREDGTCWVNMGDSYSASGMGGNPAESEFRKQATNAGSLIPGHSPPAGLKPKNLCGIPWRLAFALQDDGWCLRQDIVWVKPNPMPESVTDRCTKSHEFIFMLTKNAEYFYDMEAIREPHSTSDAAISRYKYAPSPGIRSSLTTDNNWFGDEFNKHFGSPSGRNCRSVWTLPPEPCNYDFCLDCGAFYVGAERKRIRVEEVDGKRVRVCRCGSTKGWVDHFAAFPSSLPTRCIKAGTSEKGACPSCGKSWERVVDRQRLKRERPNEYVKRDGEKGTGNSRGNTVAGVAVKTVGFCPACDCKWYRLKKDIPEPVLAKIRSLGRRI